MAKGILRGFAPPDNCISFSLSFFSIDDILMLYKAILVYLKIVVHFAATASTTNALVPAVGTLCDFLFSKKFDCCEAYHNKDRHAGRWRCIALECFKIK